MPVRRITQDKINKTHNKINKKSRERPRLTPRPNEEKGVATL
jgi:hypothetical protein